jgi:uncharacterized protein YjbI with pentapeptide repeats
MTSKQAPEINEALRALKGDVTDWELFLSSSPNISNVLAGVDLSEADLAERNLSGIDLTGTDFFEAKLSSANLKHAKMVRTELSGADLSHAGLYKAKLTAATLTIFLAQICVA